jgi:hypothetical protein
MNRLLHAHALKSNVACSRLTLRLAVAFPAQLPLRAVAGSLPLPLGKVLVTDIAQLRAGAQSDSAGPDRH